MEKRQSELKNPPVIEAWIEFDVDLTEEKSEWKWDKDTAQEFIKKHFPDFEAVEFFGLVQVKFDIKTQNLEETGLLFNRVRAFTKGRDRCVQASRNAVVFNLLKKDEWPGFENLRDGAFQALKKYMDFRQLHKLKSAAIHYRDIVAIPKHGDEKISLDDWFTICPRVPEEEFGTVSALKLSVQLTDLCKESSTVLTVQSAPPVEETDKYYRFVMDWHVTPNKPITDENSAKRWLDATHSALKKGFRAAFTQEGLKLFD